MSPTFRHCHHRLMARTARASKGGICYHVINRGNARATVFHDSSDFKSFISLMSKACERIPMRILSYCLMPNHFHLVIRPYNDGDMSRWMQWLLTSHVRRYHRLRGTSGRVWQGRFKAFPIQEDSHLLTVMRYVERNPVRANLVESAIHWKWSSIRNARTGHPCAILSQPPIPIPADWLAWVDQPISQTELDAVRRCGKRQAPFGSPSWVEVTAESLGLIK
ncbi:MAG: transposase [Xanthomonadales bacterium]|nr:transposase [Xanthomonadales bacterium]